MQAMIRRLSLFFVCLLLLATLAEAFHHHRDGATHADCPVCLAIHHQSHSGHFPLAVFDVQRIVSNTLYLQPHFSPDSQTLLPPANNRAPPA